MDQLTPYPHRRSPAWTTGRHPDTGEPTFRVGEAERAAACDALAEHYAAGRLDPAELDDRLARAMAARTQGDLRVVFADLAPRRTLPDTTEVPAAPEPAGLVPVLVGVLLVSLLVAGGMLLVLGAYNPLLFVGALLGGTATAVAGGCATVLVRTTLRRR